MQLTCATSVHAAVNFPVFLQGRISQNHKSLQFCELKKGYLYHNPIELYQSPSNSPLFTGPIGIVTKRLAQHLRELSSIGGLKECFRGEQNPCPYENQVREEPVP